jgi:pilus assembly protein CpaD
MIRTALIASLALTLGACASTGNSAKTAALPPIPSTLDRYLPVVTEVPQSLLLAPHAQGLSANQQTALRRFADQWRADEGGMLQIEAPSKGVTGSYETSYGAMAALLALGVSRDAVRLDGYDGAGVPDAPIRLSYMRATVKKMDCSREWGNLTSTNSNEVADNFGCSVNANIAMQVASPRDLQSPQNSTAFDAQRRQVALEKYRKGEITSSAQDKQASGAVSKAVD